MEAEAWREGALWTLFVIYVNITCLRQPASAHLLVYFPSARSTRGQASSVPRDWGFNPGLPCEAGGLGGLSPGAVRAALSVGNCSVTCCATEPPLGAECKARVLWTPIRSRLGELVKQD